MVWVHAATADELARLMQAADAQLPEMPLPYQSITESNEFFPESHRPG
jgi:hypothetical protein